MTERSLIAFRVLAGVLLASLLGAVISGDLPDSVYSLLTMSTIPGGGFLVDLSPSAGIVEMYVGAGSMAAPPTTELSFIWGKGDEKDKSKVYL